MTRFVAPLVSEFDTNGNPLAGAKYEFFTVGTVAKKDTFSDEALTIPNANPVIADASGTFPDIFLNGDYDVTLSSSVDVLIEGPDTIREFLTGSQILAIQELTTATMTADTSKTYAVGDVVETAEFATGNGGGGVYDVVLTSGITPNTHQFIIGVSNALISFVLRVENRVANIAQFGAGASATAVFNTSAIQAALDWQSTATFGAFTIFVPDAPNGSATRYLVTGTGDRILQQQTGTRLIGSSLEGSQIGVDAGSTATALIEDGGSAAKIEIYNITFTGLGNTALTSIIRLGRRSVQWGAYGTMDNVMSRDAPNAIAYDLDVNIVGCGKLYSIDTKSGVINAAGAIGLHVDTIQPLGFSDIGLQMAAGDSVDYIELEAPASDDAIPVVFNEGGSIGSMIISVQAGRTVKTMVQINDAAVSNFVLNDTHVILTGTGAFGDSATPADSGTATSGASTTLTDTTKTFRLDQWKGGALFITGGTGSGQFVQVTSNTKDTLTFSAGLSPAPDATSTYALDYFIKKTGGGGFTFSRSCSQFDIASENGIIRDLKVNTLQVGASNDAAPIVQILKVVASLDFPSIPAHTTSAPIAVTVRGAVASMPVVLGLPTNAIAGVSYEGLVISTDTVNVRATNTTTGALNPPSGTFVVKVDVF